MKLLWISLFGVAGTLARYGASSWLQKPGGFPFGTLAVNTIGCLLIGIVGALVEKGRISADTRTILAVGFLGALTTFSSFAWEALTLQRDRSFGLAVVYVGGQLFLGLGLVVAGWALTRAVT